MKKTPLGWISLKREDAGELAEGGRIVHFRKSLERDRLPEKCSLHISADSRYKLYVNGLFLEQGPQKGDNHTRYYDILDITGHLREGVNVILVSVLTYPVGHGKGNHSLFRTETPGLFLRLCGESSGPPVLMADGSWKARISPVRFYRESERFAPLYIFEEASWDEAARGMHLPDFDDSPWLDTEPVPFPGLSGVLHPDHLQRRTIPFQRRQRGRFKGVQCLREGTLGRDCWESLLCRDRALTIPARSREIVEINGDVERTAYLTLSLTGGRGARVTILTSECYAYEEVANDDGFPLPLKGDRTDHGKGKLYGFTDSYLVGGAGTEDSPEIYEPYWFRTFRYVRLSIETGEEPIILRGFDFTETGYPLERKTFIETSDPTLAPIWDISERSLRLCMHDTYEDCPFYEQLQYAMDSRSQILYTYALSSDDRLARQCMDDFRRSLRPDGMINCSYPSYEPNLIPGFSLYYVAMVHDHMMYFGDRDLAGDHMPAILSILSFFRKRMTGGGIVGKIGGPNLEGPFWSFVDWTGEWRATIGAPSATGRGPLAMESLLYLMGLQYASEILEFIGQNDLAAELRGEGEILRGNIRRVFSGRGGMLRDGPDSEEYSQHCQVFGVLTGTLSPEEGRAYLKETLDRKGEYAQCSVAMMFYLFRALERCGLYGETNRLWDIWRDMVGKNLTTCEEDPVTSRSDCHAWGALILYELPAVILGVRPSAPGFAEITVNPQFGHLDRAEGRVSTPRGEVSVGWERREGGYEVELALPPGMTARVGEIRGNVKIIRP